MDVGIFGEGYTKAVNEIVPWHENWFVLCMGGSTKSGVSWPGSSLLFLPQYLVRCFYNISIIHLFNRICKLEEITKHTDSLSDPTSTSKITSIRYPQENNKLSHQTNRQNNPNNWHEINWMKNFRYTINNVIIIHSRQFFIVTQSSRIKLPYRIWSVLLSLFGVVFCWWMSFTLPYSR